MAKQDLYPKNGDENSNSKTKKNKIRKFKQAIYIFLETQLRWLSQYGYVGSPPNDVSLNYDPIYQKEIFLSYVLHVFYSTNEKLQKKKKR